MVTSSRIELFLMPLLNDIHGRQWPKEVLAGFTTLSHVLTLQSMEFCPPAKGCLTWAMVLSIAPSSPLPKKGLFLWFSCLPLQLIMGYIVGGYLYHLDVGFLTWGLYI